MDDLQLAKQLTYAQHLAVAQYKALDSLLDAFDEAGLLEGMPDTYKAVILRERAKAKDAFVELL